MTAVKTVVATAVIVFALTAVAMAGVQHYTKPPSAQAAGKAPVQYTVTLTAKQLARLMGQGRAAATRSVHHARHAQRHHKATHRQNGNAAYRTYSGSSSRGRPYSGSGNRSSYRCYNHRNCGGGGSGPHSGGGWGSGGCW